MWTGGEPYRVEQSVSGRAAKDKYGEIYDALDDHQLLGACFIEMGVYSNRETSQRPPLNQGNRPGTHWLGSPYENTLPDDQGYFC